MLQVGSIDDTVARLAGWRTRSPHGIASVEYDSEPARTLVVEQLRGAIGTSGPKLHEMRFVVEDRQPSAAVSQFLDRLSRIPSGLVSITGFDFVGLKLNYVFEILGLLNLQRDVVAEYPLWQIWWLPTYLAEQIGRSIPDLTSWFLLRLHLVGVPLWETKPLVVEGLPSMLGVDEARMLSQRLAEQASTASARRYPRSKVWRELATPSVHALRRANLDLEADELEARLQRQIGSSTPSVFISYSQDSLQHSRRVLELADRLRADGVPAVLDQYETFPPEGWPRWTETQIRDAEAVLAICTDSYKRQVMGEGRKILGVHWEGAAVYRRLSEGAAISRRFIPVLLDGANATDIPTPLRIFTFYDLTQNDGYQELLNDLIVRLHGADNPDRVGRHGVGRRLPARRSDPRQTSNVPIQSDLQFFGREETLRKLATMLRPDAAQNQPKVLVISGTAGVGKTQLAIEFARRAGRNYDALLWARADSESSLNASIIEIARLLNLPDADTKQQSTVREAVKAWLDTHDRWLLVIDDLDDPRTLQGVLPSRGRGTVLVTARTRLPASSSGVHTLQLESLSLDESVNLLSKSAGRDISNPAEKRAAEELALVLGMLPLAIQLAGTYIAVNRLTFQSYLRQYQSEASSRAFQSDDKNPSSSPALSIAWQFMLGQLGEPSSSAQLLRLIAFFAPNQPVPLLQIVVGASELPEPLALALAESIQKPSLLQELVEPLIRFSLVQCGAEDCVISVHDLIQDTARATMAEDARREWANRAVRVLNRAFPSADFQNWPVCDRLSPHVIACADWITKFDLVSPETGELLRKGGAYLFERARYPEAESLWLGALGVRTKAFGERSIEVAAILNNLALLYDIQGRYGEAESLLRRAIGLREEIEGSSHPDVATCLNNLAVLYQNQGRYAEAELLHQRALAIRSEVFGTEHPETAASMSNLALVLDGEGKFAEAETLALRSLAIRQRLLGEEHPAVASSLNNLANVYAHMGRLSEAAKILERALSSLEKVLGKAHPDVATTLNNLAAVFEALGKTHDAQRLYERSVEIRERTLGPENLLVAGSLNNLAITYSRQGRHKEADRLFARALLIYDKTLGPIHERTLQVRRNQAQVSRPIPVR